MGLLHVLHLDCATPPCTTVHSHAMNLLHTLHVSYLWPLLTVVAILYLVWMLYSLLRQTAWNPVHRLLSLAFLILLDLQLVLGIVLWIVQQRWSGGDALRSFEHPVNMIVALVVYHVGYRRLQRDVPDRSRFVAGASWGAACLVVFGLGIIRIKYL